MIPSALRMQIQSLLKMNEFNPGPIDGDFGIQTYAALRALDVAMDPEESLPPGVHRVKASSFADLKDVSAFNHCISKGNSDNYCFKFGDNGKGFGGLTDCTDESIPYIALPPEEWETKFGNRLNAVGKPVEVTIDGVTHICKIGDTMPHYKYITNGAGLDLAPGAQKLFKLRPPFLVMAMWKWSENTI